MLLFAIAAAHAATWTPDLRPSRQLAYGCRVEGQEGDSLVRIEVLEAHEEGATLRFAFGQERPFELSVDAGGVPLAVLHSARLGALWREQALAEIHGHEGRGDTPVDLLEAVEGVIQVTTDEDLSGHALARAGRFLPPQLGEDEQVSALLPHPLHRAGTPSSGTLSSSGPGAYELHLSADGQTLSQMSLRVIQAANPDGEVKGAFMMMGLLSVEENRTLVVSGRSGWPRSLRTEVMVASPVGQAAPTVELCERVSARRARRLIREASE